MWWWISKQSIINGRWQERGRIIVHVCVHARSVVSDSLRPHGLLACQVPLSMGCSRQEYWSGLPLPPPGIFPTQELNPYLLCPLYCRWTLYCWATREAHYGTYHIAIFLKKTIFFQLYLYPHHENIFVICLRAPSSQPVSMHPPCFYVIHFLNQSNGYPKNQ